MAVLDKLNSSTKNVIKYVLVPSCIILSGFVLYPYQAKNGNDKSKVAENVMPSTAGELPDADENKTQLLDKNKADSKRESEELSDAERSRFDLGNNNVDANDVSKNSNGQKYNPSADIQIKPPVKDYYNRDNRGANTFQSSSKNRIYSDSPDRDGVTYHDSPKGKKVKEDETIMALRKRVLELEGKKDSVKPKEVIIMPNYIQSGNNSIPINSASSTQRFYSATNSKNGVKVGSQKKNSVVLGEIMESKQVKQQSSIKIKLLEDFDKNGLHIESGTYLTGLCVFSGSDRVEIKLNSLVINSTLVSIKGDVLDLDGNIGIQIPNLQANAVRSTALSRITSGATSSASPMFFLNSQGGIGQQVAGQVIGTTAGNAINTGQNILMNKLAEFKANLNTGHRVYINITEINY